MNCKTYTSLKMKLKTSTLSLLALLLFSATATQADDYTFNWNSASNNIFLTSTGADFPTTAGNNYTFAIGTFSGAAGDFSGWQQIDTATYVSPALLGGDRYNGSFEVNNSGASYAFSQATDLSALPFLAGAQMYVWIYGNNEQALLTNATWVLPSLNVSTTDSYTDNLGLPDSGTYALIGTYSLGFDALNSLNDQVTVQMATTLPVPEPGGALLIGTAGLLAILRRRRLQA